MSGASTDRAERIVEAMADEASPDCAHAVRLAAWDCWTLADRRGELAGDARTDLAAIARAAADLRRGLRPGSRADEPSPLEAHLDPEGFAWPAVRAAAFAHVESVARTLARRADRTA